MIRRSAPCFVAAMALLVGALTPTTADAQIKLKDICRVKGQEENLLQGLGIVVGLKGTGDGASFLPTVRSLAKIMTVMGEPTGKAGLAELKDTKNVALVAVSATVPAAGARQGDKLDCIVSSVGSAKSLAGGRLFLTALMGPDKNNPRIYALAEGSLTLEDAAVPTTARITDGCQLEEDFFNPFTQDNRITLVLDQSHADFEVAQDIAELINADLSYQSSGVLLARAVNASNVEVQIPPQYRSEPVMFVAQVLSRPMLEPQTAARVVINERAGTVVISGDVEIGAVAITHKNIVVSTGTDAMLNKSFVGVDPSGRSATSLKALVDAMNAVHLPTHDIIDVIKAIDRNGKLHAQLIVE